MSAIVPWVLVIVLSSLLVAVATHYVWSSRGGTPLQALGACGTAGVAVFGIGMALLNTFS
jgi:hypothetical protein